MKTTTKALFIVGLMMLVLVTPTALAAPTFTALSNPATPPNGQVSGMDWSPDGTLLCMTSSVAPRLAIYQRSGNTLTKLSDLSSLPGSGAGRACEFSPDGNFVTFGFSISPFVRNYQITAGPTFTALSNPATLPPGDIQQIAWHPASTYMATASVVNNAAAVSLYSVSGTTFTKEANLPNSNPWATGVGWSADGNYFSQLSLLTPFLITWSISGTTYTKLSDPASLPAISSQGALEWTGSTGTHIAVATDQSPYIYVYSRSGSTLTKLANPATLPAGTAESITWSPNSDYVAVSHSNSPLLSIYEKSGSTLTKIANPSSLPPGISGEAIAWSDDGAFLSVGSNSAPAMIWYSVSPAQGNEPDGPATVTATPGDSAILLAWSAAEDALDYVVCRDTVSHPGVTDCALYGSAVVVGNVLSYLDTGLTNGQEYFYRIRSRDATFAGGVSSEVSATPGEPGAPVLSGRSWRANAELRWTPGTFLPVVNYYLYKGDSPAELTLFQTLEPEDGGDYDDPQNPGECDFYSVQSASLTEESPLSNVIELCYEPPPPPLFGDSGTIWGAQRNPDGSITGGQAELAAQVGMTTLALGILYGIIMTLSVALGGYLAGKSVGHEWMGALIGAVIGVVVSTIIDFFPVWLVAFVGVTGTVGIILIRRKGE